MEVGNGSNKRGKNRFNDAQIAGVNIRINVPEQTESVVTNGEWIIMPSLGVCFLQEQQGAVDLLTKLVKVFLERTTIGRVATLKPTQIDTITILVKELIWTFIQIAAKDEAARFCIRSERWERAERMRPRSLSSRSLVSEFS